MNENENTEKTTKANVAYSGLGALIATVIIGVASQCQSCTQKQAETAADVAAIVDCDSIDDSELSLICDLVQKLTTEVAEIKDQQNGKSSETSNNEEDESGDDAEDDAGDGDDASNGDGGGRGG